MEADTPGRGIPAEKPTKIDAFVAFGIGCGVPSSVLLAAIGLVVYAGISSTDLGSTDLPALNILNGSDVATEVQPTMTTVGLTPQPTSTPEPTTQPTMISRAGE